MRILDIATLGGIVVCFILVIFGIVFDKNAGLVFGNLSAFIDAFRIFALAGVIIIPLILLLKKIKEEV